MPKLSSVLLVDDDTTTNFLNKLLFSKLELTEQLLLAENGKEALAVLAETCAADGATCPRLILLDINMPVMNGIEFLEAYRHLPLVQRQAVIVLLTTSLNPHDLAQATQLHIAGTLSKPLTSEKLQDLMQRYFPAPAVHP